MVCVVDPAANTVWPIFNDDMKPLEHFDQVIVPRPACSVERVIVCFGKKTSFAPLSQLNDAPHHTRTRTVQRCCSTIVSTA
eukprot:COSAG02_NODE_15824_length_1138_cov_1.980751_2_plen_81_part_00